MSRIFDTTRTAGALVVALSLGLAACGPAASPSLTFTTVPPAAPTASPVASVAPSATIATGTVDLAEWKVVTASTLKAGKATFTITNSGTTAHEFLVFKSGLAAAAYPTDPAGDIVEEGGGVDLLSDGENIDPGGTQTREVDLVPGTYLFVCNIPGHFKSGMFQVVTVTQ